MMLKGLYNPSPEFAYKLMERFRLPDDNVAIPIALPSLLLLHEKIFFTFDSSEIKNLLTKSGTPEKTLYHFF